MSKSEDREFSRLLHRAYIRDGAVVHTGQAVLVACVLHSQGQSRNSDDMVDVRKIMRDRNLTK